MLGWAAKHFCGLFSEMRLDVGSKGLLPIDGIALLVAPKPSIVIPLIDPISRFNSGLTRKKNRNSNLKLGHARC